MNVGERTIVGDVAREYCQRYPAAASRALARMLTKDKPETFKAFDAAFSAVRYYRGNIGDAHRAAIERAGSGVGRHMIPAAEEPEFGIVDLPEDVHRWLLIADPHAPSHDANAVNVMLDWATERAHRCDGVIYLGDVADCYQVSSWLRDPRKKRFLDEMRNVENFLDSVAKAVKPKKTILKIGNHEDRWERYLMNRAPEFLGLNNFTLASILHLGERDIQFEPKMHMLRYHALHMLHGDEWGGWGNPVNPARTACLKLRACAIVAHGHQTSEHVLPSLGGTVITCWSLGCMCQLHPNYRPINDWNHGFGELETDNGDWTFTNHRIIKGRVK